jgi:hypothetical protein
MVIHRSTGHRRRLSWLAPVAASFTMFVGVTNASAVPVVSQIPATFVETISFGPGLGAAGVLDDVPENIAFDFQQGDGQAVASAKTSASAPQVDVQASNTFASPQQLAAGGTVNFALMIVPIDPLAPFVPVPIQMSAAGSASIQGTSGDIQEGVLWASSAEVTIAMIASLSFAPDPGLPHDWDFSQIGNNGVLTGLACASDTPGICDGFASSADVGLNATFMATPNLPIEITKRARVAVAGGFDGQAVVDPVFTIDPLFCVDVEGTCRPANQLYELAYSEGINGATSGTVAEPGTLGLLAMVAGGLAAMRRRRDR